MVGCGYDQLIEERRYNQLIEERGYNQLTKEEDDSSTKACPPLMFYPMFLKGALFYCFTNMHAILFTGVSIDTPA